MGPVSVSEEQLRVPHVREVAVIGNFAVIGGHAAWLLGRLLSGYPGGLELLLARSGISVDRRGDVLRAVGALVHAGTNWRLEHEAGSGSGTSPSATVAPRAPLHRVGFFPIERNGEVSSAAREASPLLGTTEVASILGVSTRLVRRLASAGALSGQRDVGGRWQFAPADLAAERTRRMSAAGDAAEVLDFA
jgi:hypothetical protein